MEPHDFEIDNIWDEMEGLCSICGETLDEGFHVE